MTPDLEPPTPTDSLSAAQRKRLRAEGRALEPSLRLGKRGLTEGVIAHVRELFSQAELIKLRFERSADLAALTGELHAALGCTHIQTVGRNALFYRPRPSATPGAP